MTASSTHPAPDEAAFSLRLVGTDGLELLVRTRMDFCVDAHPDASPAELAALEAATRDWMGRQLAAGTYLGVVGQVGDESVCCSGLLLYVLPPLVGNLDRPVGHVLNFYTYPAWRCRGYGTAMIEFLKTEARARGIGRLVLNATNMGEPLYRQNGFTAPDFANLQLTL